MRLWLAAFSAVATIGVLSSLAITIHQEGEIAKLPLTQAQLDDRAARQAERDYEARGAAVKKRFADRDGREACAKAVFDREYNPRERDVRTPEVQEKCANYTINGQDIK
jgi:hypothetical protein